MLIIVPTDRNYLEPALITLNSILLNSPATSKICLLYLKAQDQEDIIFESLIATALTEFNKLYQNRESIQCIAVHSNYFTNFSQFHLTSATLQKLVFPVIFPEEDICLSMDAGMIFGTGLPEFLQHVAGTTTAAITAFTTSAKETLQPSQISLAHNNLYPAGGILAFRPGIYNKNKLLDRCVQTFNDMRQHIIYGEQDIICFTLDNQELDSFAYDCKRIHIDLANDKSWQESDNLVNTYISQDYLYMKHVGVFKPWRQWVLSPAKSIYIHALRHLPAAIHVLTKHPKICSQHTSSDKFSAIFFEKQLSLYEEQLNTKINFLLHP